MAKPGPKTGRRSQARPRQPKNKASEGTLTEDQNEAAGDAVDNDEKVEGEQQKTPPAAGHNSGDATLEALTDEQQRALFIKYVVDIERLNGAVADVQEELKEAKKAVKDCIKIAKEYGFDKEDIEFALRLRKNPDNDELERRRREARVAAWINHPIGTQSDLFEVDRTPDVDKSYAAGKMAGLEGKTCAPPHAAGTEQEQSWIRGWHDGQSENILKGIRKLDSTPVEDAASGGAFEDALPDADSPPVADDASAEPSDGSDPGEIPGFLRRSNETKEPAAAQ